VVEELATRSSTHDRVIGNAKILFVRRQQRDLRSIASDLNAAYIVLGQVQSTGDRVRVLAHLIRASDQTHLWVVRIDRPANGILQFDDAMADQIASELSSRLADNPDKAASFKAVGH
jgi:TolB-like protein